MQRYANRWRLEKKDPAAALSEPKQPIVFWLDRNIPVSTASRSARASSNGTRRSRGSASRTRSASRVQPDDADFDTSDIRHASVRWQTVAKTSYGAIGPSVVDPRTGEILDADIGIDANNVRVVRNLRREYLPAQKRRVRRVRAGAGRRERTRAIAQICTYDDAATEEAAFGAVAARGARRPRPGQPGRRPVRRHLPEGRRRCTRSATRSACATTSAPRPSTREAQLDDPEFTREERHLRLGDGVQPVEPRRQGREAGRATRCHARPVRLLGDRVRVPRDARPSRKPPSSSSIASRSSEPWLAYSTDEDVAYFAVDPAVNQLDLGSDPLAYATKRLALVRELWQRTEHLELKSGDSYSVLRRNFTRGLNEAGQGAVYASKYVGGLTHAARSRRQRPPAADTRRREKAARGARHARRPRCCRPTASTSRPRSCAG